jgi:hypothetical protein
VIGFAYTGHGELREVTLPGQGAITMIDFRWTRPETVIYPGGAIRTHNLDVGASVMVGSSRVIEIESIPCACETR